MVLGPRADYDEDYENVTGAPESYIDGYDVRFAQKYSIDRAEECSKIEGDQYYVGIGYGCIDSGLTKQDCDEKERDNGDNDINHEQLQEAKTSL